MKVRIENKRGVRDETIAGLKRFFKTPAKISFYQVTLHVELSEEERAILTEHKLWDTVVFTHTLTFDPDELAASPELADVQGPVNYGIKHIASDSGFHKAFSTPVEAENFCKLLQTEVLPNIKKYIEASRNAGTGSVTSFEL